MLTSFIDKFRYDRVHILILSKSNGNDPNPQSYTVCVTNSSAYGHIFLKLFKSNWPAFWSGRQQVKRNSNYEDDFDRYINRDGLVFIDNYLIQRQPGFWVDWVNTTEQSKSSGSVDYAVLQCQAEAHRVRPLATCEVKAIARPDFCHGFEGKWVRGCLQDISKQYARAAKWHALEHFWLVVCALQTNHGRKQVERELTAVAEEMLPKITAATDIPADAVTLDEASALVGRELGLMIFRIRRPH